MNQQQWIKKILKKKPDGYDPYVEQHFETDQGLQYGSWNKYQGQKRIDERSILPNEIVIDIDAETTQKAIQENKKVITYLETNGYDNIIAHTGGTGFHIHLFFQYEGIDWDEYREYRIALYEYLKTKCREEVNAETELWDDHPVRFDVTNSKGHLVRAIGGRKTTTANRKTAVTPSNPEKTEVKKPGEVEYPANIPWSLKISKTGTDKADLSIKEINEKGEQVKQEEKKRHQKNVDTSNIDTRIKGIEDVRDIPASKVLDLLDIEYDKSKAFKCPFHDDNSPSANLHTQSSVERLYCFSGCVREDESIRVRNAIDIMEAAGYEFMDAIKKLSQEFDFNIQIGFNPRDYFDTNVKDNYVLQPQRLADEITKEYRFKNVIGEGFYVWKDDKWTELSDDNDIVGTEVDKRLQNETSAKHRNNVRDIIKNRPSVKYEKEEFQEPEGLIPFKNGVYDIEKDELVEHKPEYNFDYVYEAEYRPGLENDDVERFIHTIMPESEDDRRKLKEIAALCMAPWKINQKVPIFYGQGSNGKNQFVKIVWKILGDASYHKTSAAKLQNDKFEMASVIDKQMAFFDEFEDVTKPGQLKTFVGDEQQNVREMRKESYTAKTSVYPIFAANKLPNANDESDGFYRRWEIIDFKQKFTPEEGDGNPTKIPAKKLEEEYMNKDAIDSFATELVDIIKELNEDNTLTGQSTTEETRKKWKKKGNALYAFIDKYLKPGDLPDKDDGRTDDWIVKDELLQIVNNYMEVHNNSDIKKHQLTRALDSHPDFRIWKTYRPTTKDGDRPRAYAGIKFHENSSPDVQRFLQFIAYSSPPITKCNEHSKWVDMVDDPKVAEVLIYLTSNNGDEVSLFDLVKQVDLKHEHIADVKACEFIEIGEDSVNDEYYPTFCLDLDAVNEADIDIDLAAGKISRQESLVKSIVEVDFEEQDSIEIQELIDRVVEEKEISEDDVQDVVDKWLNSGEWYEPSPGFIRPT